MTENTQQPNPYGPQPNPLFTHQPPHQPWPQAPRQPTRQPGKGRRGAVAIVAGAVLAAGALGGAAGAYFGHDTTPGVATVSTPLATPTGDTATTDVSAVVAKVKNSVVEVTVTLPNGKEIGSGVILSADGRILTNNHVIADAGNGKITVTFADGRTANATVVGSDATSDLAVIKADGVSGLTPATLGDSSQVKVGQGVIAIGSPGGLQNTVTTGIVSALNREVNIEGEQQQRDQQQLPFTGNSSGVSYKAIQTDASINQGNSGGPLFDLNGTVIGINSAMYSPVTSQDGSAGSVGIGFSIPINTAKSVIAKF
jgi:putative serine protease PepD